MAKRLYGVDPIQRFNQKYIIDEQTKCWEWQDTLNNDGYGMLRVGNKMLSAHRFAYEYFVEPLDYNYEICHKCNNRKCVNPEHLRQDTKSSNMIDSLNIGTLNFQKLNIDQVIQIKKLLKNYYRGQCSDLAKLYQVDRHTISNIKRGKTWSHVKI